MSDNLSEDVIEKTGAVTESKLYAVAREQQLLSLLIPDLRVQIEAEVEIDDSFPRTAEDKDATRILLNYTNVKGKSAIYKLLDEERLDRKFDIDHFMNGLMVALKVSDEDLPIEQLINTTLMTALNMSTTTILGVDTGEDTTKNTKAVSEEVLRALVAILFNDALDVLILVNELPLQENQVESLSVVTGMWIVKSRPQKNFLSSPSEDQIKEAGSWYENGESRDTVSMKETRDDPSSDGDTTVIHIAGVECKEPFVPVDDEDKTS